MDFLRGFICGDELHRRSGEPPSSWNANTAVIMGVNGTHDSAIETSGRADMSGFDNAFKA